MTNILNEKAILTTLRISQWRGSKKDKAVTSQTNAANNAAADASTNTAKLITLPLKPVTAQINVLRDVWKTPTKPWLDQGTRILPTVSFDEFTGQFETELASTNRAVDTFCNEFAEHIEADRDRRGDMFDFDQYPSPDEIRKLFSFEMVFSPIPDGSDFRAELSKTQLAKLSKEIESTTRDMLQNTMRDSFEQIAKVVGKMSVKLGEYQPAKNGGKVQGTFRDSLVTNIADIVKVLPSFNLTSDPAMAKAIADMKALADVSVDDLRNDAKVRKTTADKAAKIVRDVSQFI